MLDTEEFEYAGFWVRCGASIIDLILIGVLVSAVLTWLYGPYLLVWTYERHYWMVYDVVGIGDDLISWAVPAAVIILFWRFRQATPGKMIIGARIVDAETGKAPSTMQCIGRYLGYFVSAFICMLGFVWIAFDSRKQGWHDKLAGTVVIKKHIVPDKASFPESSS